MATIIFCFFFKYIVATDGEVADGLCPAAQRHMSICDIGPLKYLPWSVSRLNDDTIPAANDSHMITDYQCTH